MGIIDFALFFGSECGIMGRVRFWHITCKNINANVKSSYNENKYANSSTIIQRSCGAEIFDSGDNSIAANGRQ
jgi:hypothetical protein